MLLRLQHRRRSRPTRQDGEAGTAGARAMLSAARVHASTWIPPPPTHHHHHHARRAKRRPKTTTKQLNRRYPAVLSAGVINRVLSVAPGTRKPHRLDSAAPAGHTERTFGISLLVVMINCIFSPFILFCVLCTLARPHTCISPGV